MKNNNKDYLHDLFSQLPEKQLSPDFRMRMMRQIEQEALRIQKRNRRFSWLALGLASAGLLVLGILTLIHLELSLPSFRLSAEALATVPFYLYIVFLAFLLLLADHYLRKRYREKHKEES